MLRRVLAGVAAIALLAACGSSTKGAGGTATTVTGSASTVPPSTTPPPRNLVATAIVASVPVFAQPGHGDPVRTFDNPVPPHGSPLVFLVRDEQPEWLEVMIPIRPNGSTGWVRKSDVKLVGHDFRMVVELAAHRLTVWEGDTVFAEEAIGTGAETAPTPLGLYYTTELLQPHDDQGQPTPDGTYGPYVYSLSGYSEVIFDFTVNGARGDGRLAIHGTNKPASIGQSQGNGCIRISNDAITKLANSLPLGVPVEIRE